MTKEAGLSLNVVGMMEISAIEIFPETCKGIEKVRETEKMLMPNKETADEGDTKASDVKSGITT